MGIEAGYIIEGGRPNDRRQAEFLIYDKLKKDGNGRPPNLVSSFWDGEKEINSTKLLVIFGPTAADVDVTKYDFGYLERTIKGPISASLSPTNGRGSLAPTIGRENISGERLLPAYAIVKL